MKKRIGAAVLLLVILFTLCSCTDDESGGTSDTTINTTQEAAPTEGNNDFTDKYTATLLTCGYDGLESELQRSCYIAMKEKSAAVTRETADSGAYLTEEIFISGNISDRDIFVALTAFKYDNPGAFWLKESFTSAASNSGVTIRLCSYYSPEELTLKKQELDVKVREIFSSLESGMSDYELELYIHDYIMENCEYDSKTADEINNGYSNAAESFTCYGALVKGKSICQGYTDAMSYLLSCVGVENTEISGTSQGVNHIWNAVKIDGDWYYLDATWDDHGDGAYRYDYFNITTSQLENDHIIAANYAELSDEDITGGESDLGCNFNIFIPDCQAAEYNYYVQDGAVLQGFDNDCDSYMSEQLLNTVLDNQEYFQIYIDTDYVDYDYACQELFDPYLYHFQEYVEKVNNQLEDKELDASAAIVKKESLNVITVKLSYLKE